MNSPAKSYAAVRDAVFPESSFFFPSPSGGHCSARWMQGKLKRFFALSKPDVPLNVHPHLWRHTRAMHLYQHGIDLTLISQRLGHKQLETTLIYAHADTEAKRKAITEAIASDSFLGAESVNYTVSDEEIVKRLYGL